MFTSYFIVGFIPTLLSINITVINAYYDTVLSNFSQCYTEYQKVLCM